MNIEGLRGKKLLFVEGNELVGPIIDRLHIELGDSVAVRQFEIPPDNIDRYIEMKIFDGAIVHTSSVTDEGYVNKLHQSGVQVVVMKRDLIASKDEEMMNNRFKEQGITMLSKSFNNYFQALEKLSQMFEKNKP